MCAAPALHAVRSELLGEGGLCVRLSSSSGSLAVAGLLLLGPRLGISTLSCAGVSPGRTDVAALPLTTDVYLVMDEACGRYL